MAGVTIDDIGEELGIANSTVSRALRDDPRISDRVIREVKRAANRMGYVPNMAAQSLRTGKSKMIGLLVRDIRDGLSAEMIPEVEAACAEHSFGLLLCNSDNDPHRERFYLQRLRQRQVEGVLLLTPTSPLYDPYLAARQAMPLVLVDMEVDENSLCAVTVDHVMGGYLATKYLLDLGHRRIAYLSGPLHLSPCTRVVKGYKQAMAEAGLPPEENLVVVSERTDIAAGGEGMLSVLKISPQPTAMAVVSDMMAVGALDAARKHGIRVPADFSIIGYDDIPMASVMTPPLTTVAQDRQALGRLAVQLLLDEINEEEHRHRQEIVAPRLVVRDSTAPPPEAAK